MGFLTDILETFRSLIVTIPLDNGLAVLYVVLGAIVNLFTLFSFGGSDGGGGLGGGL